MGKGHQEHGSIKAGLEVFQVLIRHYMREASKGREHTKKKGIAAAVVLPQLAAINTKCGCWLHWGTSMW